MDYQGKTNRTQEDYIFSDVMPYNPEFDLDELKNIENKLKAYTSGRSEKGLTPQEAEIFLDWISLNARKYAVSGKDTPEFMAVEAIPTESMTGQCAPTQKLNVELLRKIGLDARPFNTADCIGQIPVSQESMRRMQNGFSSPAVRHSVSLVNIPIIDQLGNTAEYKYLLDPTFRQFCLKENCNESQYREFGNTVAPHPGYFMVADNLQQLGVPMDIAKKTEDLGKLIVSRGYFYLNDENAKLYVNAFRRASINKEYQYLASENISGREYIRNFENTPMQMTTLSKGDRFFKLPSEIEQKREGLFSRIKNYFKNIFNKNDIKALPEGSYNVSSNNPYETFKKQYETNGVVQGVELGKVQQLDNIVRNISDKNEMEIGDE